MNPQLHTCLEQYKSISYTAIHGVVDTDTNIHQKWYLPPLSSSNFNQTCLVI